ncbi:MAG: carboxypeptidase regulatory-like domain-containing protein [Gemmatirosa sp.]|nr:carboxypeptidase regulatory-like domain-containing protein [Gemmatirosa sp.]
MPRIRSSDFLATSLAALAAGGVATLAPAVAPAQPALRVAGVAVHGVAFDSLAGAPLGDAFVTLDGTRSTSSDARGRFQFDDVAPGPHVVAVQHAVLDSAGLTGIAITATITDGRQDVIIATPSFATLWHRVCGPTRPPADSGVVFGTVARIGGAPAASAVVNVTWTTLVVAGKRTVRQRQWSAQAPAAANGAYGICGVPTDVAVQLRATVDSEASGSIDVPPGHPRVQRRDLVVAVVGDPAAAPRGTIVGTVTDSLGHPIANARVVFGDADGTRTGGDGRFVLRDIPAGTRQIEVFGIGMSPNAAAVTVVAGDTAAVTVQMRRIRSLDVVRVTATRRVRRMVEEMEARRRTGLGRFMDSTQVGAHGTLAAVFREFPSLQVDGGSRFIITLPSIMSRCIATLWIDGYTTDSMDDYDQLQTLRPEEVAAVEVYPRNFNLPTRFTTKNTTCGAVVVWTKWMLQ